MEIDMKLMSLFDGSGGFPLAASLCGIEPVYASEVEPYPIAVTKSRFPNMKHLGDVSRIKGAEIEPVDIITFGSPCQDMSVAGKRAGLKHTAVGDEETTRSGLFMEAIRIIKEMRVKTNGIYPRFAVWENVPGAFSSNRGEDFRLVLEEFIKITEPNAVMPAVPQAGWAYADCISGDGWSIAYRVFDAQYWGVPSAAVESTLSQILEANVPKKYYLSAKACEGILRRAERRGKELPPMLKTASKNQGGIAIVEKIILDDQGGQQISVCADGKSPTLRAEAHGNAPYVINKKTLVYDTRGNGAGEIVPTITGDHNNRITDYTALCCEAVVYDGANITSPLNKTNPQAGDPCHTISTDSRNYIVHCLQGNGIDRADTAGCNGKGVCEDKCYTLNTIDRHAACFPQQAYNKFIQEDIEATLKASGGTYGGGSENLVAEQSFSPIRYIVRRLTPTECARLQGFPDWWGEIPKKDNLTDDEYVFWLNARNTYAKINNKTTKEYSKEQMLSWYNKLHSDSSEYKMWGNGIALPNALYVMQGIAEVVGVHHSK